MANLGQHELIEAGLASLAEILSSDPKELMQNLIAARAINWAHDPLAGGVYSYATPETRAAQAVLSRIDSFLFRRSTLPLAGHGHGRGGAGERPGDGADYSLSLDTSKDPSDPYHEFRHLQITGKLLRPACLKTDAVEVSLLPSNDMSEERRKDYKPIAMGALDIYPDTIKGSIGIPADALPPILQTLTNGHLKFILLTGSKFRYRSARLTGLGLEMKLTEDDMPSSDAG